MMVEEKRKCAVQTAGNSKRGGAVMDMARTENCSFVVMPHRYTAPSYLGDLRRPAFDLVFRRVFCSTVRGKFLVPRTRYS